MPTSVHSSKREYDVALSFAGEDRGFVEATAKLLRDKGVRVFYDKYEEAALWGKDLYVHLSEVYEKRARFTVAFLSANYSRKLWTNHERRSAQARAFEENSEYILPARFDDTPIPGILKTVGYIDLRSCTPERLSELIVEKLLLYAATHEAPPHEVVEGDGVYWPPSRPEVAMIDIKLDELDVRIAINPSSYTSLRGLLDDLFTSYLSPKVKPYSYGSEWIMSGEPFGMRVASPIEWIPFAGKSICTINALWATKTTLRTEGIIGGSYWKITDVSSISHSGFYGVLTNSDELAALLNTEAKAISLLTRHFQHLSRALDWEILKDSYRFQLTYQDWLNVGPGSIFVDVGEEIPNEIKQIFARD